MDTYVWTSHVEWKMKYYGLSKQKVSSIIRRPDRIEKGIAGNGTVAVMQAVSPKMIDGRKVWRREVWTMYIQKRSKSLYKAKLEVSPQSAERSRALSSMSRTVTIISAWRYPGVSPKRCPIPEDILREVLSETGDILA